MTPVPWRQDRRLVALVVATALCYAIGYPLALGADSSIGWVFVVLGGPLLIAIGVIVVGRVHASSIAPRPETPARPVDD